MKNNFDILIANTEILNEKIVSAFHSTYNTDVHSKLQNCDEHIFSVLLTLVDLKKNKKNIIF